MVPTQELLRSAQWAVAAEAKCVGQLSIVRVSKDISNVQACIVRVCLAVYMCVCVDPHAQACEDMRSKRTVVAAPTSVQPQSVSVWLLFDAFQVCVRGRFNSR